MVESDEGGAGFLTLWVIYKHPRDFPQFYVVRQHHVNGDWLAVSPIGILCRDLDEAREQIPGWLHCLGRFNEDDPAIVEVWL